MGDKGQLHRQESKRRRRKKRVVSRQKTSQSSTYSHSSKGWMLDNYADWQRKKGLGILGGWKIQKKEPIFLRLSPPSLRMKFQFYLNPFWWYNRCMNKKLIDFSAIDIRVCDTFKGYKDHSGYCFIINNLFIEHVPKQQDALVALKTQLWPGDSITLDTYFGWYDGKDWLSFPLKGKFLIKKIDPQLEVGEIRLEIKRTRLLFPFKVHSLNHS